MTTYNTVQLVIYLFIFLFISLVFLSAYVHKKNCKRLENTFKHTTATTIKLFFSLAAFLGAAFLQPVIENLKHQNEVLSKQEEQAKEEIKKKEDVIIKLTDDINRKNAEFAVVSSRLAQEIELYNKAKSDLYQEKQELKKIKEEEKRLNKSIAQLKIENESLETENQELESAITTSIAMIIHSITNNALLHESEKALNSPALNNEDYLSCITRCKSQADLNENIYYNKQNYKQLIDDIHTNNNISALLKDTIETAKKQKMFDVFSTPNSQARLDDAIRIFLHIIDNNDTLRSTHVFKERHIKELQDEYFNMKDNTLYSNYYEQLFYTKSFQDILRCIRSGMDTVKDEYIKKLSLHRDPSHSTQQW